MGAVIVTHRSGGKPACLVDELRRYEPDVVPVIVDSGSPSGETPSVEGVATVALDRNVGYGAACNRGVAELRDVDAYLFLNPDVSLTGPSVSELAEEMMRRPEVGVATGPVVDQAGRRVPSAWGPTSALRAFWFAAGWQLPRMRRLVGRVVEGGSMTSGASTALDRLAVDGHVLGGAMLVRRTCFEDIGGFDEEYFLYWEDADLCERARGLGWQIAVLPCTPFVHAAGTSSADVLDEQRWDWYIAGARTFARKHLSKGRERSLMGGLRWGRRLRRR